MNYNSPIYDPIFERDEGNFYPANEPTLSLVLVGQIYRDIESLYGLIYQSKDDYTRGLLLKYVLIEWFSLDAHLIRLFNQILRGDTGYLLETDQKNSVKSWKNRYEQSARLARKDLKAVRNKISAHRDPIHLSQVARYWDMLNTDTLAGVCNAAAQAFNILKSLPVYKWTKIGCDAQGRRITAYISPLRITTSDTPEAK